MSKIILFVLICLSISFNIACSSETATNANSANKANVVTNIDPKNMPPGLSGNVITPSGNSTPGIPSQQNINAVTKGATPTPGIPADPGKPLPKGATPTPGIPDPATLKKQMNSSSTASNTAPASNQPMTDGDSRPRTVQKP
jgi:hypothetical protein